MGLDLKKFRSEIEGIRAIKASQISEREVNELLEMSMTDPNLTQHEIDFANRVLADNGYTPKQIGRAKVYYNPNFG